MEFNKGAVTALPGGVTKPSGLRAALADLGLSPHNAVGIGAASSSWSTGSLVDDLRTLAPRLLRARLLVGQAREAPNTEVMLDAYESTLLVAGPSGSGKSNLATALVERLFQLAYQLRLVDPEGDYEQLEPLAVIGSAEHAPTVDEIEGLLVDPARSGVANLLAVPMEDRPGWFVGLLARLQRCVRACADRTGSRSTRPKRQRLQHSRFPARPAVSS